METPSNPVEKQIIDEDLEFPLPIWFVIFSIFAYVFRRIGLVFSSQRSDLSLNTVSIGHRGARIGFSENSREAFEHASNVADGFELDTQLSTDGIPIVLHDATLDRTTSGEGRVENYTWDELKKITLENGEFLPSLEEILEQFAGSCIINVEIKKESTALATKKSAREVCRIIQKYSHKNPEKFPIIISSFSPLSLYYCNQFQPKIPRAQLIADPDTSHVRGWKKIFLSSWIPAIAWQAIAFVWEKTIPLKQPKIVSKAHKLRKKCWVYTSNEEQEWKDLMNIRIDGIIADNPKFLKEFTCQFSGFK
jgi:glycerophosphoryl diester phosphodiesterase